MTFAAALTEAGSSEPVLRLALPLAQVLRKRCCSCLFPELSQCLQRGHERGSWWLFIFFLFSLVGLLNLMFLLIIRKVISFFLISAREEAKHKEQQIRPYQTPGKHLRAVEHAGCRAAEEARTLRWDSRSPPDSFHRSRSHHGLYSLAGRLM